MYWTLGRAMGTIRLSRERESSAIVNNDAVLELPGHAPRGGQILHRMRRAGALRLRFLRVRQSGPCKLLRRVRRKADQRPVSTKHRPRRRRPAGSSRSRISPAVERRQLTVLFCDLVGSTLLSSRLDPEELREVIGAYHRCVADTVERFGGFVARYMGDGALVYFGYPHRLRRQRRARGACGACARREHRRSSDVLAERLHVRIGIATGLVVVGELVNAGAAREQTALGETPNLAARLQAIADPDAIVIAETTRRLVDGLFECRDLGAVALSGFAGPVRAWQVVGEEPIQAPLQCA